MIIIHGDDSKKSYERLTTILKNYKEKGVNTHLHQLSELTPTLLRQELGGEDLFAVKNVVVIYGFLSTTKSKVKEAITKILQDNLEAEVILYEEKEVTATVLKSFPKAITETFKISPVIFKFLETLRPGNQKIILPMYTRILGQNTEPEFVFAMLVRQIKMLIQAKNNHNLLKTSPYAKKLFVAQADNFSLDELISLHHQLYKIDKKIKTGSTTVDTSSLIFHFLQTV